MRDFEMEDFYIIAENMRLASNVCILGCILLKLILKMVSSADSESVFD